MRAEIDSCSKGRQAAPFNAVRRLIQIGLEVGKKHRK
jgi:hypothetical protein